MEGHALVDVEFSADAGNANKPARLGEVQLLEVHSRTGALLHAVRRVIQGI